MDHTFAVPVYGAAPNLASLIDSLRAQRVTSSAILLATSTPSTGLEEFAQRQALPLHVNPRREGIAADWNFAFSKARTTQVTLAHQDDLFAPDYAVRLLSALDRHSGAVIAFSDYGEHTASGPRPGNLNLRIKRALCTRAFRGRECIESTRDKLRLLAWGNPICCPSVMFNRALLGEFSFPSGFQTNLDWLAWIGLARGRGGFVYVPDRLVSKAVHADSETTATISSRARLREDRALFAALWPQPVAAVLATAYRVGYLANRVPPSIPPRADADHSAGDERNTDPLNDGE